MKELDDLKKMNAKMTPTSDNGGSLTPSVPKKTPPPSSKSVPRPDPASEEDEPEEESDGWYPKDSWNSGGKNTSQDGDLSEAAKDNRLRRLCEKKPSGRCHVTDEVHRRWALGGVSAKNFVMSTKAMVGTRMGFLKHIFIPASVYCSKA